MVGPAVGVPSALRWKGGRWWWCEGGRERDFGALHFGVTLVPSRARADGPVGHHSAPSIHTALVARTSALLSTTGSVLAAVGILAALWATSNRKWDGWRSDGDFVTLHPWVTLITLNATADGSVRQDFTFGVDPAAVTSVFAFAVLTYLVILAVGITLALGPDMERGRRDARGGDLHHFGTPYGGDALIPFGTPADGSVSLHLAVRIDTALIARALTLATTARLVLTAVGVFAASGPRGRGGHWRRSGGDTVASHARIAFVPFDAAAHGAMSQHRTVGVDPAPPAGVATPTPLTRLVRRAIRIFATLLKRWARFGSGSGTDWRAADLGIAAVPLAAGASGPFRVHFAFGVHATLLARMVADAIHADVQEGTVGVGGASAGRWCGSAGGVELSCWWQSHYRCAAAPWIALVAWIAAADGSLVDDAALGVGTASSVARKLTSPEHASVG